MVNQILLGFIESVLGKSNPTARGNHAFSCPFCHHKNPKLEINLVPFSFTKSFIIDKDCAASLTLRG